MSAESRQPDGLWQRFRRQPGWRQAGAWIAAAVLAIAVIPGAAEESKPNATTVTVTQTVPVSQTAAATAPVVTAASEPAAPAPPPFPPTVQRKSPRRILNFRLRAFHARVERSTPSEIVVVARTPTGGLEGPSTGDLNHAAGDIFEVIYGAGYTRASSIVFRGGLYDTRTGNDKPNGTTGIYRMSRPQAAAIRWRDKDRLLYIEWNNYRDFAHPALKQDEGGFGP